jgi:hypothetical protein
MQMPDNQPPPSKLREPNEVERQDGRGFMKAVYSKNLRKADKRRFLSRDQRFAIAFSGLFVIVLVVSVVYHFS